jgi:glycosyltransferase involved in cell wall biosynthesis
LKNSYFIGPVNKDKPPKGGDQFKNRILFAMLQGTNKEMGLIDTAKIYGRLKLLYFILLEKTGQIDKLVISASSVSSYKFIKLLNETTKRRTTYFVIGGALPEIIIKNNFKPAVYHNLKSTVVEGAYLQHKLGELNVTSTVLPNFKYKKYNKAKNESSWESLKLVFLSRITESKGVLTILAALNTLSKDSITCTFFGPCDLEMKEAISRNAFANYGGYLDFYSNPEESYSKLAEYHTMVFPTKWHGEGFPGVFLDAFMVGLPVICSDWNMNSEVIQNGYNGIVLKENNVECLAEAINKIDTDRAWLNGLSKSSMASFDQYDLETAKVRIQEIIR